jgi:ATP-dependent helicase/nuclease subunit B
MPVVLQRGPSAPSPSLEDRFQGPNFEDFVVIVPTKRRIRHLVREVMRLTGKPVTPAFPFHTLESFARYLFLSSGASRRIVSGPLQTLLFDGAVRELQGRLEYFGARGSLSKLFRGTFDQIVDVILNLKESGILPALLAEEAERAPLDEKQKLRDIAAIYAAYENALENLRATDPAGVMGYFEQRCPAEEFENLFRRLFPRTVLLTLAGFDEFTLPELGLLERLIALSGMTVTLLFDYEPGNPALFGHLESNYRRFRQMGFQPVPDSAPESRLFPVNTISRSPSSRAAADHIARHLFLALPEGGKPDLGGSITVIAASSRKEEVALICKLIKRLASSKANLDLSTVCVAMLRPQRYTDLFREECRRYGIPANITDRYRLSRSTVVTHLLGLLRLALSDFLREDVLRAASSPYFSFGSVPAEGFAANLARVSGELRISRGLKSWLFKIDRELSLCEERARRTAEAGERATLEQRRISLASARTALQSMATVLAPLKRACPPRQFATAFEGVLASLALRRNLVGTGREETIERDVRAFVKFGEVIEEMVELMEFQHGRDQSHELSSYVHALTTSVARERFNVHEQFGRGVLITSIDETRGLPMGTMIVAGLVDGEFPDVYQPEVFLSAERRKEREQRSVWQNRYLFYQAITNWSDHLYLTHPLQEGELDLVRSSYLDALEKIVRVERWRAGENVPFQEDLASQDEALRWLASPARAECPPLLEGLQAELEEVRQSGEVEQSRTIDQGHPEFRGSVGGVPSSEARERLGSMRNRVYSVTQLETYGKCPFRFFAERMLQLQVQGDLEEALTPLERGSLLHEALFDFFTRRREAREPLLAGCSDRDFERAVTELIGILEAKLSAFDLSDAFWELDRELLLGGSSRRQGLVREFLNAERTRDVETVPAYFEVSFGGRTGELQKSDPELSQNAPLQLGGLRLRGKVDRVELGPSYFTILDYKTGREIPTLEEMRRGLSLQLPLYLRAIGSLLKGATGRGLEPAAGLYYRLRTPVKIVPGVGVARYRKRAFSATPQSRQLVREGEDLQGIIEGAVAAAELYVRKISEGEFPLAAPENVEKVCVFCNFRNACRIQSARHVNSRAEEGT